MKARSPTCFGPGLYTLTTQTLPILTYLRNWDKAFKSPFKSDVYFFSTRLQTNQKWGTATPITIRDKEFGAVRMRAYGIYAYRIDDPKVFYEKVSGTREMYQRGRSRRPVAQHHRGPDDRSVRRQRDFVPRYGRQPVSSSAPTMLAALKPVFADLGLLLDSFVVENISLPDELQKLLDQRIGMNMMGDMGRYTQFQVAQSHAHRGGQRRRRSGRRGRRAGRRIGDGAADDGRHASARAAAPRGAGAAPPPARRRRRSATQVLHQLRQAHSARGAFLLGMRRRATVSCPHDARKEGRAVSLPGMRGRHAIRPCHGWNEMPVLRRRRRRLPARRPRRAVPSARLR